VVYLAGRSGPTLLDALGTQRILVQEQRPEHLPSHVVATLVAAGPRFMLSGFGSMPVVGR